MPTIKQVKKSFEDQLQALFILDQTLDAERRSMRRKAFIEDRILTNEEVIRRKQIASTRSELAEAISVLALDTVDALEKASDVDELLMNINIVNTQLNDDLDKLKKLEGYAKKVEKIANGFASVFEKLIGLKSSFF